MSGIKLDLERIYNALDPVFWLEQNTGFHPFSYQAEILADHALRLRVIRKSRQIGITTNLCEEAIWKACTSHERLILIVSPSDRQSKEPMRRIQVTVDANPKLAAMKTAANKSEIDFANGSRIISCPNNPDRLRVYAANDIYLDEAAHFLNDEPVMAAIRPMLIATKGTFTIISTPFGKRGLFWTQYQIATDIGVQADGSAIDPTVKAYNLYPSTISPIITQEDLERERPFYTDLEWRQEYQGEFIEEVDVYFPMTLIEPCVKLWLANKRELLTRGEPGKSYIWGIDLAKKRAETVIMILEGIPRTKESPQRLILRYIEHYSGMDYSEQIGRMGELKKKFPISVGYCDQTGVGEAVIEDVVRTLPNVEGIEFTTNSKVDIAGSLRARFETKTIEIPNEKKLLMQINGLHYEISKIGNILFDSPEKERIHDDYLWALALGAHAARKPQLVVTDLFSEGEAQGEEEEDEDDETD
jgi:phage FluMu gp28-like protein